MLTRIKGLIPGHEGARGVLDYALAAGGVIALVIVVLMILFDHEPAQFDVRETTALRAATPAGATPVRGATTTATMIEVIDRLLHKRGGYLSNDVMPPGLLMDNVPNWEYGALVQTRDLAIALRNDLSRSQT
ncbi:MAG: DUF2333 family protein, partial [Gammaproteobacteria bacterium]